MKNSLCFDAKFKLHYQGVWSHLRVSPRPSWSVVVRRQQTYFYTLSFINNPTICIYFIHAFEQLNRIRNDANAFRIAAFGVLDNRPLQFTSFHTASSRRINFNFSSYRISGSKIPARHRKTAGTEPQLMIGEPFVRNVPLPSE